MLRLLLLTLLVILTANLPAAADNAMAGLWKSGSITIRIPDSGRRFNLIIESPAGKKVWQATWVTMGSQFQWTDAQGDVHTATLDPKNPDKIKDVNPAFPDSPAYWYRSP